MGLTRIKADQISNIDYKQAVRVITLSSITLSGGAPTVVDGVTLVLADRILVAGQSTASQNGLYYVTILGTGVDGTWSRTIDADATGEVAAGMIVMVTEGTTYKDSQWKLTTNNPIVVGTTSLTFEQNSAFAFGNVYANGTAVIATTVGDTLTLTAGTNIQITGNISAKSVTIGVTGLSLNSISNGTSNVNVVSSGGNVTVGVAGTSNVAVFSGTGANIAGTLGVTGNITGGNVQGTIGTFSGNVTTGNVSGTTGTFTNVGGTLTTAAQTNITSVGTLTSLAVTGNITSGNLSGTSIVGTLTTASQTNITSVGTLGSLAVTGNITSGNLSGTRIVGTLTTAAQANITSVGTLTSLAVTGNITSGNVQGTTHSGTTGTFTGNITTGNVSGTTGAFTNVGGTLTTAAQTNITSTGTLGTLAVTGNITSGNLSGTSIVGTLTTAAQTNITSVGTLTALTLSGNVNMSSKNINNLLDPVSNQDAATKYYVDLVAQGLHVHTSAYVATTGTLATATAGTVTYNNGTSGVGAKLVTTGTYLLIDGGNVQTVGTRILVKNEANTTWNGVYTYSNTTVIVRSTDFDTPADVVGGDFLFVTSGSTLADTGWVQTTDAPITFGTSAIVFAQFSGAGTYQAGTGLTLTGQVFSVNASQTQITTVGTLGSLAVTGNITSGNVQGTAHTGTTGTFTGNVTTGNVSGTTGAFTNVGGTLTTAAQTGITSVGNLTGLTVSNVSGLVNFITTANVSLGNVSNLHITGGSNNQVLTTNGSGGLSWTTANGNVLINSFTGNGSQTIFTLSSAPTSNNYVQVNINGITQLHNAFTVSGANVTMSAAPYNGSSVEMTTFNLGGGGSGAGGGTSTAAAVGYSLIFGG